jgi:predicted 2-oxoglutarate/Fe(II)-dependent dioxygenase YbiX
MDASGVDAAAPPTLVEAFLSPAECRDIVREIDAAHQEQAQIWRGDRFDVHPDSRMGTIAQLTADTEVAVQDRLWDVLAALEQRFGCEVFHVSGVTALLYRAGDHFAAHSDGGGNDDAPAEVRRRRVSLVIALNDGAGERPDFHGGELEFYAGSVPASAARSEPVSRVLSRTGLLIAFASSTVHRVAPVLDGRRYSLALWALAPDG